MEERYAALTKGQEVRPRRLDVIIKTKTGQERIISVSTSRITLAGGIPATLNITRDITRRKGMEQSLESTNKFLSGS
jgi:PAS domain S-box-containing protein